MFENLEWAVAPGQTTLLLGPNGAGKSTLLKLLSGFERPQRGSVALDGVTTRRALYEGVGWMPQDVQPARGLNVLEQIEYVAWLAGANPRDARSRAREALGAVDLEEKVAERADRLSGGQLRRLGLAQALVRQAPVLLLDEPTVGLDPAQALNFRALMRNLKAPGGVVISTHQVDDLAADVDRVVVLNDGTIRFDGTVEQFRALGTDAASSMAEIFMQLIGGGRH
ncbi:MULTISPECIES: ABC transporter ATP-binding protein [unclassified Nocardioides]|uniref:ABC transporter ATP-binding protein n=1 Tax=unclassified Nocardioides TaxID=2615069 RepID=UPI0018864EDC|nr:MULTISPECIES: ABC transporter ATP-binding protein [unclassified Nocardioides]